MPTKKPRSKSQLRRIELQTKHDDACERAWEQWWAEHGVGGTPEYVCQREAFYAAWNAAMDVAAGVAKQHDHGHNRSTCKLIAAAIREMKVDA